MIDLTVAMWLYFKLCEKGVTYVRSSIDTLSSDAPSVRPRSTFFIACGENPMVSAPQRDFGWSIPGNYAHRRGRR